MSRTLIRPTKEEDAAITAAALADPDTIPLSDAEWNAVKATVRRGRQRVDVPKLAVTIRYDAEVIESFKATGKGWQTRMNTALKDWLKTHSPA